VAHKSVLDSFRLDGKIALVTGGSRGLGRTMALALAQAGADVALTGRTRSTGEEAASAIADSTGRRCRAFAGDVTLAADVDRVVAEVEQEYGRIDILINNAGIQIAEDTHELPVEQFDRVLAVNLRGSFLCAQ
jgi:NAD(P)-dependent dehydrogenase (short-subunit alcohol dehydrogenase family)